MYFIYVFIVIYQQKNSNNKSMGFFRVSSMTWMIPDLMQVRMFNTLRGNTVSDHFCDCQGYAIPLSDGKHLGEDTEETLEP